MRKIKGSPNCGPDENSHYLYEGKFDAVNSTNSEIFLKDVVQYLVKDSSEVTSIVNNSIG